MKLKLNKVSEGNKSKVDNLASEITNDIVNKRNQVSSGEEVKEKITETLNPKLAKILEAMGIEGDTDLGDEAVEPVHNDKAAVEHTPEVSNDEVYTADSHEQAEDVKEVIIEEISRGYLGANLEEGTSMTISGGKSPNISFIKTSSKSDSEKNMLDNLTVKQVKAVKEYGKPAFSVVDNKLRSYAKEVELATKNLNSADDATPEQLKKMALMFLDHALSITNFQRKMLTDASNEKIFDKDDTHASIVFAINNLDQVVKTINTDFRRLIESIKEPKLIKINFTQNKYKSKLKVVVAKAILVKGLTIQRMIGTYLLLAMKRSELSQKTDINESSKVKNSMFKFDLFGKIKDIFNDLKSIILKEELGDVAVEPVHNDKAAVEHTPEVTNDDVYTTDSHEQAEDVKEVIVEANGILTLKFTKKVIGLLPHTALDKMLMTAIKKAGKEKEYGEVLRYSRDKKVEIIRKLLNQAIDQKVNTAKLSKLEQESEKIVSQSEDKKVNEDLIGTGFLTIGTAIIAGLISIFNGLIAAWPAALLSSALTVAIGYKVAKLTSSSKQSNRLLLGEETNMDKTELGSAAVEPIHDNGEAKELTPEVSNDEVYTADEHKQAEDITPVVVESEDFKEFISILDESEELNEGVMQNLGYKMLSFSLGILPEKDLDKIFNKALSEVPADISKKIKAKNPSKKEKLEALRAGLKKVSADKKGQEIINKQAKQLSSKIKQTLKKEKIIKESVNEYDVEIIRSAVNSTSKGILTMIFSSIVGAIMSAVGLLIATGSGGGLGLIFLAPFVSIFGLVIGTLDVAKGKNLSESELGDAAATPVHNNKAAVEHTPEITNDDVYTSDDHEQAEEVDEVLVEAVNSLSDAQFTTFIESLSIDGLNLLERQLRLSSKEKDLLIEGIFRGDGYKTIVAADKAAKKGNKDFSKDTKKLIKAEGKLKKSALRTDALQQGREQTRRLKDDLKKLQSTPLPAGKTDAERTKNYQDRLQQIANLTQGINSSNQRMRKEAGFGIGSLRFGGDAAKRVKTARKELETREALRLKSANKAVSDDTKIKKDYDTSTGSLVGQIGRKLGFGPSKNQAPRPIATKNNYGMPTVDNQQKGVEIRKLYDGLAAPKRRYNAPISSGTPTPTSSNIPQNQTIASAQPAQSNTQPASQPVQKTAAKSIKKTPAPVKQPVQTAVKTPAPVKQPVQTAVKTPAPVKQPVQTAVKTPAPSIAKTSVSPGPAAPAKPAPIAKPAPVANIPANTPIAQPAKQSATLPTKLRTATFANRNTKSLNAAYEIINSMTAAQLRVLSEAVSTNSTEFEGRSYQEKFAMLLKKYNVASPAALSDENKKEFFSTLNSIHTSKAEANQTQVKESVVIWSGKIGSAKINESALKLDTVEKQFDVDAENKVGFNSSKEDVVDRLKDEKSEKKAQPEDVTTNKQEPVDTVANDVTPNVTNDDLLKDSKKTEDVKPVVTEAEAPESVQNVGLKQSEIGSDDEFFSGRVGRIIKASLDSNLPSMADTRPEERDMVIELKNSAEFQALIGKVKAELGSDNPNYVKLQVLKRKVQSILMNYNKQ
jgi:hypothetical protein